MEIDGRAVRRLLVTWLMDAWGRPLTVPELAARLEAAGFVLRGRGGKVVSDSLRWEVARGRVRRIARGTYVLGEIPRTTAYRIRKEAQALSGERGDVLAPGALERMQRQALDRFIAARRPSSR